MRDDALLLDRIGVREMIEHYFFGVDAKDLAALRACFCEDAEAEYHCSTPDYMAVHGGQAIAHGIFASCSRFSSSNHSISNFMVKIDEDVAEANTFAIAHVIVGNRALIRGLRYQDTLVRSPDGWRISRRLHTPLWQMGAEAIAPKFF